jgi:arylsulfatase A-like enzyme
MAAPMVLTAAPPRVAPPWVAPLLATLALAAGGCGGDPPAPSGPARPNVLLITIDTLRADHLGCYGYAPYPMPVSPAIDSLAAEGLRFEACFAPRGQTGPSLMSLLTGLYPSGHGVLDNYDPLREEGSDLVDDFAPLGHELHGFAAFCPVKKSSRTGLAFARMAELSPPRGSWLDARPKMKSAPWAAVDDAIEQALLQFLDGRRKARRPFFAWAHFYDVHQPWSPPAAIHEAFAGDYRGPLRAEVPTEEHFDGLVKEHLDARMRARTPLEPADARYVTALYDGGIRATDDRVGRIVSALRSSGLLDSTIVCVTADHGEELGEHGGFWFHGNSVYDSVLSIPLVIRGPGVVPGVVADLAQNLDLLPTLLEFLGGRVPSGIDGLSLAPLLRGERPDPPLREIAWAEWEDVILAARTREWKLIRNVRGARPKLPPYQGDDDPGYWIGCRELYDVRSDPRETRDVWRERNGDVLPLRRHAEDEEERRFRDLVRGTLDAMTEEERAELLRLGYGGAGPDGARTRNYRLDPGGCDE